MDHDEHDHDDEGECVAPVSSAAPSADLVRKKKGRQRNAFELERPR